MSPPQSSRDFDREYFDRFYRRRATRASSPEEFGKLTRLVLAYLKYLEVEIREVLDLGCGLGRWKEALATYDSRIRYTGVDISPWACERFGWRPGSVESFRSPDRYDLVICQDVLPYLDKPALALAVDNIARHCRGAAYLQVVTSEDWDNDIVDPERTDRTMNRFDAAWYRRLLGKHFRNCGAGVFLPRGSDVPIWEMEHC